jgi:hypothetical protein
VDHFLERELEFSEFMLTEARDSLREAKYEDAEAFARTALGGFLSFQDDTEFFQRAFRGIQEASGIALEARRLWIESGSMPLPEVVDRLREKIRQEVDEFDQGLRAAAHAAIHGLPFVRRWRSGA